jgi:hypothetical protein
LQEPKTSTCTRGYINQIAALCVTHCAETDEDAQAFAGPEGVWFVNMAEKLYAP